MCLNQIVHYLASLLACLHSCLLASQITANLTFWLTTNYVIQNLIYFRNVHHFFQINHFDCPRSQINQNIENTSYHSLLPGLLYV